jgi:hypothetical protein
VDTICWRLVDDVRLIEIGRRLHKRGLLGLLGTPTALLHHDHRRLTPTRAGRRVLRDAANRPRLADPEVVRVALGGRQAMTDPQLRAAIFDQPGSVSGGVHGRPPHELDFADGWDSARRTRAEVHAKGDFGGYAGGP